MKNFMITFRSVTYAQRGQKLLGRGTVVRTPRRLEQEGCGYGLKLRAEAPGPLTEALDAGGIPWKKLWLLEETGEVEL